MTNLSPRIRSYLDTEYGPVQATFNIDKIPEVGAPDAIKEQWLGIPLPVRERNLGELALGATKYHDLLTASEKQNDEPVPIVGLEAVDALVTADRLDAVRFWLPHQMGLFTFRASEGQLEFSD